MLRQTAVELVKAFSSKLPKRHRTSSHSGDTVRSQSLPPSIWGFLKIQKTNPSWNNRSGDGRGHNWHRAINHRVLKRSLWWLRWHRSPDPVGGGSYGTQLQSLIHIDLHTCSLANVTTHTEMCALTHTHTCMCIDFFIFYYAICLCPLGFKQLPSKPCGHRILINQTVCQQHAPIGWTQASRGKLIFK